MAVCELREIFPILENLDGSGFGLTRVVEGQAASSVSGAAPVLTVKDTNGNLTFFQLDPQGRLPVTMNAAGTLMRARGQLDCGNATSGAIAVTGATIALTPGKTYVAESMVVSCFRETYAQLVWNNNGVDNIMDDVLLGPGQYTFQVDLPGDSFIAGTGTQTLEVRARNTTTYASAIRASVTVAEVA